MSTTFGVPVWTEGNFRSASAENDLGLEAVGASLLRRLLPGILSNTDHAGYYAFYVYLLAKWEGSSESIERQEFIPFFRRQEIAYACACRLHEHRFEPLRGVWGSLGARRGLEHNPREIDLGALSLDYIRERLGGYGAVYGRVLQELRLVRRPETVRMVERVSDRGRQLATAFAEAFEQTRYYRDFFDANVVPVDVLRELGGAVCLCTIPGRADHQALLDTFVGGPEEELAWEARRQIRVRSLSLHLAYHDQRPDDEPASLLGFRSVLASGAFGNETPITYPFVDEIGAWRCYQLRECQTLVLTAVWSWYLQQLQETYPTTHEALCEELVTSTNWGSVGIEGDSSLSLARAVAAQRIADGRALVEVVSPFEQTPGGHLPNWLALAVLALLAIDREADRDDPGLAELRDDGGAARWSLAHLHHWLAQREDHDVNSVLRDLVDELRLQHLRVATPKLSATDSRDPFCIAEDNGVLRFVRVDYPFWTGARFDVLNALLWSLGLLSTPSGDARPTDLGLWILDGVNAGA